MKVYVAGPYSGGDVDANVRNALIVADRLMGIGCAPYVPHLSHFQHLLAPRPYEEWMALDLEWLSACDCLVRLPGHSPGADREVAFARQRGLPVFEGVEAFLDAQARKE